LGTKSFFRYLPLSDDDRKRGLFVSAGGYTLIPPHTPYPPAQHPPDHDFRWERGRVLSAHQLVYISRGRGSFEAAGRGKTVIEAGDVFLLFPGIWHRYAPDPETGWDEHWFECGGANLERLYRESGLDAAQPVVRIGVNEAFLQRFYEMSSEMEAERVGHPAILAAIATRIVAETGVLPKRRIFRHTDIEKTIDRAKALMVKRSDAALNMEKVAEELNIGYTWFRRMFREYTGMSPGRYHLQLRLHRARNLLQNTHLTVSQIAAATGFATDRYFVRFFREKTGRTPNEYRREHRPS